MQVSGKEAMGMELIFLAEQVVNGLLLGFYYLLIALGLSIIFSLGGVVNLAHGAFFALGAYFMVTITGWAGYGVGFVASPLLVAILGMIVERLFLRRFYKADPVLSLLFTFGLAMVIEQSLRMIYGASPLQFSIPPAARGMVTVGDFMYPNYRLAMLAVALAALGGTWWLLRRTAFGKVVRAGISDPDMVRALGISLAPVLTAVCGIGIGLAGLAGALLSPVTGVHPAMGHEILTAAFVVVVIGGLGSFWGVVVAAVLVGVLRGLTAYFYPPASEASLYLLMLAVLLLRPRGIMGERMERLE
ncbi:High-affinity branched-chain amino acid transport system permease protein LivH (TC 3.A.1.4.1) [plant metagenome]|uniref:High-affinity branched-chain amino acid transport system permease protein LivH (TC 3.A.1.4.1) n=3 Tax=root TaxID=1 RepID=A0A1C3K4B8_9BURK|nr:High-affinity branched-chain amino acid transport system permease protein LivH (TC 3.A.1.4.1) [Orrella dioscoreae]SOE47077.1 High-affinity branched-chain amino acid transport system permease protein LivH (TC 3.A.1.4.1) [Orrella dioscoreae]